MIIPKIIHFIWMGRSKLIPDRNILTIFQWIASNPQFEVWLWIENENLVEVYNKKILRVWQQKAKGIVTEKYLVNLFIKDIVNSEIKDNYIDYEITRFRPNYRAASDLLRYKILYKFGGAYFDSDIEPGDISLEESLLFERDNSYHQLYVDRNSQNIKVIGNDALIATVNNSLVRKISEAAMNNYHLRMVENEPEDKAVNEEDFFWQDSLLDRTYRYDEYLAVSHTGYIEVATVYRTGPALLRSIVEPILKKEEEAEEKTVNYLDNITRPKLFNDRSWLEMPIQRYEELSEAIEVARSNILFELKYMGMLRLEDYVENIIESTGHEAAGEMLLETLDAKNDIGINHEFIKSIQLTYRYESTMDFYHKYGLIDSPHVKVFIETNNEIPEYQLAIYYAANYYVLLVYLNKIQNVNGEADDQKFKELPRWEKDKIINCVRQSVTSLKHNPKIFTAKKVPAGYKEVVQQVINLLARFLPIVDDNLTVPINELVSYLPTIRDLETL